MTIASSAPAARSDWIEYLSAKSLQNREKEAAMWDTARKVVVVSIVLAGAAVLLSPLFTPVSYVHIFSKALTFAPLLFPVPLQIYNYCAFRTENARFLVKKILFLQQEHPNVERDPGALKSSFAETFGTPLSEERLSRMDLRSRALVPVLSHLSFLKREIAELQERKSQIVRKRADEFRADLAKLLEKVRAANQNDTEEAVENVRRKITDEGPFSPLLSELLQIEELQSSPGVEAATDPVFTLRRLKGKWKRIEEIGPEERWKPVFAIERSILFLEAERIFLWTFLLRGEDLFFEALERHGLQIEESIYRTAQKHCPSLSDFSIARTYKDPAAEYVLSYPGGRVLMQDVTDPEKRESTLERLLRLPTPKREEPPLFTGAIVRSLLASLP